LFSLFPDEAAMLESLTRDVRYAIRMLLRAPGFSIVAILTIAVGVGATAGVFSVVNAVLLRPLPFDRPDDLVLVSQQDRRTRMGVGDASPANFLDWRTRNRTLAGMAAMRGASLAFSAGDRPEQVAASIVSANFFDVLGVRASLGRTFQAGDEGPGAARVAILSHEFWRQRFGDRADAVGQVVRIGDEPHTIVGVLPSGLDYPERSQIWIPPHWSVPDDPLVPNEDPKGQRGHGYIRVLARVKPDTSRAAVQADLDAVAAALEREYPAPNANVGIGLVSLRDDLVGDVRPGILMLFAAVGLLLVLATANVAGLLVARATGRQQEMAIRAALGASRPRIVRQLTIESLLLSTVGGAAGVLLAMWIVGPVVYMSPASVLLLQDAVIDARVLVFALLASTSAGILFGLAPVRHVLKLNVHEGLKQTARGSAGPRQRRLRAALAVTQIALSLVLLVSAGLTIKSLIRLQQVPPGFDPSHVLTVRINLPQPRYPAPERRAMFWNAALGKIREIPGVETAGATSRLPLIAGNSSRSLLIDARTPATADYRAVTPDYFRAIGIPLLQGRTFEDSDGGRRPPVAVISTSMAAQFWPKGDAVGQHITLGGNPSDPPMTVIGVVGDIRHASLEIAPAATLYAPYRQDPWASMTFAIRTHGDPEAVAEAAREAIWQIDKDQPIRSVATMDDLLASSLAGRRFGAALLSGFGTVAIALAAIGLYGLLAFIVSQQRREIGVRMALGATRGQVVADVVTRGLALACSGVLVGLGVALGVTRLFATMLFGVAPTDAATFATVAALMLIVAIAASAAPAWRAGHIDPLEALRDG
jgi:putative ABC transport system permease protein